jgi:glycosyltransferase involved in cell wall biosynthesis
VALLEARPPGEVRLLSTPNAGQARALNAAFRVSTGDIIGWLSSDDAYYDSDVVSDVVAAFLEHPKAAVVYGHAILIDADGYQLQTQWVPPPRVLGFEVPMHIFQPAAFIRRSALGDQLVDESFDIAMDTELWLRLGSAHPFVRLDRILAAERHHAARKSHTRSAVGEDELKRLAAAYGRAGERASDAWAPRWRIAFRLAGLSLVPSVERHPSTFAGALDSYLALAWRQSLLRRARMQSGSDTG